MIGFLSFTHKGRAGWGVETRAGIVDLSAREPFPTLREVIEAVAPREGGLYLDVTLGGGGHSEALLEAGARVVGCDRDPSALEAASRRPQDTESVLQAKPRHSKSTYVDAVGKTTERANTVRPYD